MYNPNEDCEMKPNTSHNARQGILLSLTQFYSDIYMKRNFALLNSALKPDAVLFLGDIMDGGREWLDDRM
jgi:hypothetical protein